MARHCGMAIEIRVPRAQFAGFRVQVERWLVDEGDYVEAGQALLEVVHGDKVVSVAAPEAGYLESIKVPPGSQVMTGVAVGVLDNSAAGGTVSPAQAGGWSPPAAEPTLNGDGATNPFQIDPAAGLQQPPDPGMQGATSHDWIGIDVDLSGVLACLAANGERELSHNIFIMYSVANALKTHGKLNRTWSGGSTRHNERVHLELVQYGYDGRSSLLVENADQLGLRDLSAIRSQGDERGGASEDLARRATFCLNLRSATGITSGSERIHHPQMAILNVDRIGKRPVVVQSGGEDTIALRTIVGMSLVYDSRAVDGLSAVAFLQELRGHLESFSAETAIE